MNRLLGPVVCAFLVCFSHGTIAAQPDLGPNTGDETILVEYAATGKTTGKTSYSSMVKRLASNLIGIDLESTTTFGQNRKDKVIKGFADLDERMQYRFDVDSDEIELKITLNL
jgi:hypothetical protein